VLLSEVVDALQPRAGETYIDGTFGAGGYTSAILDAAPCRVIALDRDERAIAAAGPLRERYGDRLTLCNTCFDALEAAAAAGLPPPSLVDGVVLDIGVSSMQLDDAARGFSFQADGPLDMRMGGSGASAADFVNAAGEEHLANVIFAYGEERRSRAVARAIVRARAEAPFTRTLQLAEVVSRVFGGRKVEGRHPATRTFQALRIHVNDELGQLARALAAAERVLKPGGRLVVVTFHSLEDRIVKRFFATRTGKETHGSRHLPPRSEQLRAPSFRFVNPRPLTPSKGELEANPRARSARLRAAVRTDAPAWPLNLEALGVPEPGG
jgi:16S rRNA (cytosine1402-N4)-methyltransferase